MKKMTMLALGGLLGLGLVFGSFASSNETQDVAKAPVRFEGFVVSHYVGMDEYKGLRWRVTAVDDVVVKDLIINRGNQGCDIIERAHFRPAEMHYGDTLTLSSPKNHCNPIEAKVVTNKGDWVFDLTK